MKKAHLLLARTTSVGNRHVASRDRLWAALCLVFLLMTAAHSARGAVIEAWVQRSTNDGVSNPHDYAAKVVRDAKGDIIVTGTSKGGMLTIKYAGADGSVLWQNRYDGPNGDYAQALAVDGGGNVVVAGVSDVHGQMADYPGGNFYTANYASLDGALLWENRYNDPANGDDGAFAVAADGRGTVVATGFSSNTDFYTAKEAVINKGSNSSLASGLDDIVPVTVKRVTFQVHPLQFLI